MASDHEFNLCESTLRTHTRDVYRHRLPGGEWTYCLRHEGKGTLNVQIRALDQAVARWSNIDVDIQHSDRNQSRGRFRTLFETDIRFIFSATENSTDIPYRCDLKPAGTIATGD